MIRRRGQQGVVALETALLLPLVALVLAGILQVVVVVREAMVVQEAARLAARTAAVELSDPPVRTVVAGLVPDASVRVEPDGREPGDVATVTVSAPVEVGAISTTVTGRAAILVEPGAQ